MEGLSLGARPGVADAHLACLTGMSRDIMICGMLHHGHEAPAHTVLTIRVVHGAIVGNHILLMEIF